MIEFKGVSKSFSEQKVLNDVSFTIEEGEVFGIVGHSGAGKSTLLRCINGLETYDTGSITVFEQEVKSLRNSELRNLRKNIGMIFQNFNLMKSKDVFDNIALPMILWKEDKNRIKDRVNTLLNLVGLKDKAHSNIKELSGGQKQRVGIARALSLNPEILLCDEATSALDPNTTMSILDLLMKINREMNITIVIVTHQMEVIKQAASRVILLDGGKIKASGKVEKLFMKPTAKLKNLIGEEELLPESGINIRIFFPREISQSCLITSIARELDVNFSIVWGRLERFRQDVVGSLIINVDKNDFQKITEYLDEKSVGWEVIANAD
jgi:D-methionine transport system ATP-binding protein